MSRDGARQVLGPAYALRLGDLRPWHVVEARCFDCGHAGQLRPRQIRSLLNEFQGAHRPILDLQRRLVCRNCGNRRRNTLRVARLERNA